MTKVHYTELLPHEFRARMGQCAVGYLPAVRHQNVA
jgi:hypothetical protein